MLHSISEMENFFGTIEAMGLLRDILETSLNVMKNSAMGLTYVSGSWESFNARFLINNAFNLRL